MTDRGRSNELLAIGSNIKERGSFRGAHPFVAITNVVGRPQLVKTKFQLPGSMRTISSVSTPLWRNSDTRRAMGITSPVGL